MRCAGSTVRYPLHKASKCEDYGACLEQAMAQPGRKLFAANLAV
jgi:hypothetical protein